MKNKILLVSISVGCAIVVILSAFLITYNLGTINEKNDQLAHLINLALKVQYNRAGKNVLEEICTPELQEQVNEQSNFHKKGLIYLVDKRCMDTLVMISDNMYTVRVRVKDFSGSYIQVFTFTRTSQGSYVISNIEFDV